MTYELASRAYDSELVTPPGNWSPPGHPLVTGGGCPDKSSKIQAELELVTPAQKTLPVEATRETDRVGITPYNGMTNGAAHAALVTAQTMGRPEKGPN
jgi:hypothetical protein